MYSLFKIFFYLVLFSSISSCAHFNIKELNKRIDKNDNSFFSLLSKEYENFAKFELNEMHDEIDANHFALKGINVLKEKKVYVENPNDWSLTAENLSILIKEYDKVNSIISKKLYIKYPKEFALMVVGYDCWVEQLEENWQIKDIENCKSKYSDNYVKIINAELQSNSTVIQKSSSEDISEKHKTIKSDDNISLKNNEIETANDEMVVIFFAFDSTELNDDELEKLDKFIKIIKNNPNKTILVNGHTDRKGSEKYNLNLSLKRANKVRNYLQQSNVKNIMKTEGFGERFPLINTYDNIEEKENRRTEVIINNK